MRDYRLYLLNVQGRITRAVEFLASCDDEAIDQARARHPGESVELWSRDRIVKTFPRAERAAA